MSKAGEEHNISRVHTFAEDVEEVRAAHPEDVPPPSSNAKDVGTATKPSNKQKARPKPQVVYTPPSETEAAKSGKDKNARGFLEHASYSRAATTSTEQPVPTPQREAKPTEEKSDVGVQPEIVDAPAPAETPDDTKKTELEEEIAKVSTLHDKQSILSDSGRVFDTEAEEGMGEGTIIQDKRHKQFRLLPAIGSSIANWWRETREAFAERTAPEPEVSPTPSPVDKAKQVGTTPPPDDFAAVLKNRTRTETRPETPDEIFDSTKPVEPDVNGWRHFAAEEALEKKEDAVPDQPEQKLEQEPEPEQPARILRATAVQPEATPVSEAAAEPEAIPTEPEEETPQPPEPRPEPVPIPKPDPVQEPVTEETPIPSPLPPQQKQPAPKPAPGKPNVDLRPLSIKEMVIEQSSTTNGLATIVVVIAVIIGVATAVFFFRPSSTPNFTVTINEPPALIETTDRVPLPLTSDRDDLLQGIREIIDRSPSVVQVYPTAVSSQERDEPASAQTILTVLDPQMPGRFARSIEAMTFGGDESKEPFLILEVTNFDTAFAGMLEWETAMNADLAPLFGEPVVATFDPNSRTSDGTRSTTFTDGVIANRSARILFDELGLERLIYTFIDETTILITTNRESMRRLVPLIR